MAVPELEIRFLDCFKLMRRKQQVESITLLSTIGSLLVKKGQQTFIELLNDEIAEVNRILGETDENLEQQAGEEKQEEQQQKMIDAIRLLGEFDQMMAEGKIQRGKI